MELKVVCSTLRLTNVTQSTARTIVTDVNYLREYFENIAHITSSKQGYSMEIHNSEEYLEKKREILEDEPLFIILERIFFNELLSIYDWADYFHVSESTMIKYLKKITDEVNRFNITLDFNPVNLIGDEADIRNFYFAFYYESDITPHTVFPSIAAQEAVLKISNLVNTSKDKIASFGYFSYLLYLSIERILCECYVKVSDEVKILVLSDPTFNQYKKMVNDIIEDSFQVKLNVEEAIFIYTSILCRRSINSPDQERLFCVKYNKWPLITTLTNDFYKLLDKNFGDRQRDLILFESFFTSLKIRSLLSSSGVKNIEDTNDYARSLFKEEYQMYYYFLKNHHVYNDLYSDVCLEDFCANLTLFTESVKEQYWMNPMNIAFAIEGNEYISQYIEAWVKKYFGTFQNIHFLSSSDLSSSYIEEKGIELLVTNYNEYLSLPFLNIDYILLKTIPDASDWAKLLDKINPKMLQTFALVNA